MLFALLALAFCTRCMLHNTKGCKVFLSNWLASFSPTYDIQAKAAGIVEEGKAEHGAVADAGTAAPDAATSAEPQPRKRSGFGNFMASAGAAVAAPFRHGANVDIHEVTETNDKVG